MCTATVATAAVGAVTVGVVAVSIVVVVVVVVVVVCVYKLFVGVDLGVQSSGLLLGAAVLVGVVLLLQSVLVWWN